MAKSPLKKQNQLTPEDNDLLSELGIEVESSTSARFSPIEERVMAGLEEIVQFVDQKEREPMLGETQDIFERMYAVRLERLRSLTVYHELLQPLDRLNLLTQTHQETILSEDASDDALLAALGVPVEADDSINRLVHVKPRAEVQTAEMIAKQIVCTDFDQFKPLFEKIRIDLQRKTRQSVEFKQDASIEQGDWFILSGQLVYVAHVGEPFPAPNGEMDARLRVIYDNGTESNLLKRSLQRALSRDSQGQKGRRITENHQLSNAPLFSDQIEESDTQTGTIYILRSLSQAPFILEHQEVIHKIGVTGNDLQKRLANAKLDPTFLMADVEVIATYELSNINRVKLEQLIHRFFESARLMIEIQDRFGNPIEPREWFLVPLFVIHEAIEKIINGTLINYQYVKEQQKILPIR